MIGSILNYCSAIAMLRYRQMVGAVIQSQIPCAGDFFLRRIHVTLNISYVIFTVPSSLLDILDFWCGFNYIIIKLQQRSIAPKEARMNAYDLNPNLPNKPGIFGDAVIMFRDFPDILTVPQVAQALGIGKKAAYSLVNNHQIGAIRVGRTIKVPKFSLEEFTRTAINNVKL